MRLPITPLTELQRGLRDDVRRWFPAGRVILGVDGIDGAGKTVFADSLAAVFAEDGSSVFRASMDDFHRPRAERYALGRRQAASRQQLRWKCSGDGLPLPGRRAGRADAAERVQ